MIVANNVSVTGKVTSNGNKGGKCGSHFAGSSGGGSGGSILIQANSASLGTGLVTATGGVHISRP